MRKLIFLWSVLSLMIAIVLMIAVADYLSGSILLSVLYSIGCSVFAVGLGFCLDSVIKDFKREN